MRECLQNIRSKYLKGNFKKRVNINNRKNKLKQLYLSKIQLGTRLLLLQYKYKFISNYLIL